MKLAAALFVAAVHAECPPNWTLDNTTEKCYPDSADVACTTSTMTVTFGIDAVYHDGATELDTDQLDLAAAAVVGSEDDDCINFEYSTTDEEFSVVLNFNECGMDASHEDGFLIFESSFTGTQAALLRDGIITTKVLSFAAQCKFPDTATVAVDGIQVEMGDTLVEAVSREGAFTFAMASYTDATFDTAANEDNKIEIGDKVYNKITTADTLPTGVEFHVTTCTAYSALNADQDGGATDASAYLLFDNNVCTADLVDVAIDDDTGDNDSAFTSFSFNSFTFEAEADSVAVVCEVKLCLESEDECYVTTGDACENDKYTVDE